MTIVCVEAPLQSLTVVCIEARSALLTVVCVEAPLPSSTVVYVEAPSALLTVIYTVECRLRQGAIYVAGAWGGGGEVYFVLCICDGAG